MSLANSAARLMALGLSWELAQQITGSGGSGTGISIQIGAGEHLYASATDAITAKASGNQTNGTQLVSDINRVTTVATAGDAVLLPTAAPGLEICVINAAGNAMNVYPAVGDAVNALGANAAYSQGATSVCVFYCTVVNQWHTNYSPSLTTGTGAEVLATSPTITDAIQNGNAQCTTTLSAQTNTTLAAVTGMAVTVTTGGTYNFRVHLNGTAGASGGLKVAMGGTASMTSSNATSWNWNGTTLNAVTNQTTWGSNNTASTTAYTDLVIEGGFVVQTGGTVTVQAAQNASNGTATTVLPESSLTVQRVS